MTRANGVLTTYVQPSGGLISGQGCVIDLRGWVPRELVIADPAALNVTIPTFIPRADARPAPRSRPGRRPRTGRRRGGPDPQARRKEQLEAIRSEFRKAARYGDVVDQVASRGARSPPPHDPRLAALVPYAEGTEAGDLPRRDTVPRSSTPWRSPRS